MKSTVTYPSVGLYLKVRITSLPGTESVEGTESAGGSGKPSKNGAKRTLLPQARRRSGIAELANSRHACAAPRRRSRCEARAASAQDAPEDNAREHRERAGR